MEFSKKEKRRKSIPNRNSTCKPQKQQNHGTFREERELHGIFSTSLTDWFSVTILIITFDNFTRLVSSCLSNHLASRWFTSNHRTKRQSEKAPLILGLRLHNCVSQFLIINVYAHVYTYVYILLILFLYKTQSNTVSDQQIKWVN